MKKKIILYYSSDIEIAPFKQDIETHFIEVCSVKEADESYFSKNQETLGLFLLSSAFFENEKNKKIFEKYAYPACILLLGKADIDDHLVIQYLENLNNKTLFNKALENGFKRLSNATEINSLEKKLILREGEVEELQAIGVALSTEKNIKTLLNIILRFAVDITNSDAGVLYLIEKNPENSKLKQLRFALNHNYSIHETTAPYSIPVNKKSIAGYVAISKKLLNISDSYLLPENLGYSHSRFFDEKYNYTTKSILTFPMKDRKDEVIGVIQLINKKTRMDKILKKKEDFEEFILPYMENDEQMVESLASQAAVALENAMLYENIQRLFEGFVKASVSAIESRDPTTSGHSERVAIYAVELAKAVSETNEGDFNSIVFSEEEFKELRYSSLLHDFGKVGVREHVLTKAKKLYPHEIPIIISRVHYAKKDLTALYLLQKVNLMIENPNCNFQKEFAEIDQNLERELKKLDFYLEKIIQINEPVPLRDGDLSVLQEIRNYYYLDGSGHKNPLITLQEYKRLSIPYGSLDETERKEIESHVKHSYEFLKKIPWTREMENIPEIAYAHHEKLNGKGYPRGLSKDKILLQSKMISIADIYDALTASDRPYKKAMPPDMALQILKCEAESDNIDSKLLELFITRKIYEKTAEYQNPLKNENTL